MLELEHARLYLYIFGALAIAGGAMGFAKAKSRPSLIAGSASGLLLLLAGYLVGTDSARTGLLLGLVVSVALAGRFVPGYAKSRKFMPAGLMGILSVGGVVVTVLGFLQHR